MFTPGDTRQRQDAHSVTHFIVTHEEHTILRIMLVAQHYPIMLNHHSAYRLYSTLCLTMPNCLPQVDACSDQVEDTCIRNTAVI